MLDWLHRAPGSAERKNQVLAALLRAAQARDGRDRTAIHLLSLALWPGLDAAERRLARLYRGDRGTLAADLSGRFCEAVAKLDLERVRRIAATLIMNTERDVRRTRIAASERASGEDPIDEVEPTVVPLSRSILGIPEGADPDLAATTVASRVHALIGDDAGIVLAVVLRGETLHEVACDVGLTYEAARKRYQRALRRLRDALS